MTLQKLLLTLMLSMTIAGCGLFGYIPPPEETTVSQELEIEYDRCMRIDAKRNCAQMAFNVVRKVKGLEPRNIPKEIVTILEGDAGREVEPTESVEEPEEVEN